VHLIREGLGYGDPWAQKVTTVLQTVGLGVGAPHAASAFQFALLCLLNVALAVSALLSRERVPLSLIAAGTLGVVSLTPTPLYAQYVCLLLPFMVVNAALFVDRVDRDLAATPAVRRRLSHVAIVLALAWIAAAGLEAYRYTVSGEQVEGVYTRDNARNWRIPAIRDVGRRADALTPPSRREVLALWPGYFVESRTTIVPGLESPWTIWFSVRLSPVEQAKYHFMSWSEFAYRVQQHEHAVVVVGNLAVPDLPTAWLREFLGRNGYVATEKIGDTEILTLPRPR